MGKIRQCSRSGCPQAATATLTYVYADSTAVVGPLATYAEPHSYDLCAEHAQRLQAPRGWEVVRLAMTETRPAPSADDLVALADAIREAVQRAHDREYTSARRSVPGLVPPQQPARGETRTGSPLRVLSE